MYVCLYAPCRLNRRLGWMAREPMGAAVGRHRLWLVVMSRVWHMNRAKNMAGARGHKMNRRALHRNNKQSVMGRDVGREEEEEGQPT